MRKLNLEDLFSAYRLVGTLGYKNILEETTAAFKRFEKEISYQKKSGKHNINAEALKRQAGIVVIAKVMDIIAKDRSFEKAFYEFISGPFEMSTDDVKNLSPIKFMNMLNDLYNLEGKDELKAFFQSLLDLISPSLN